LSLSGFAVRCERYVDGFCQKRLANESVQKLKLSESRRPRKREEVEFFNFSEMRLALIKNRHL